MSKNRNLLDEPITATPHEIAGAFSEAIVETACENPILLIYHDELAEICALTIGILTHSKKEDK